MLVCIPGHPYMYLFLSIFSYKDLFSWNQNTAVNNLLRGLWKINFKVKLLAAGLTTAVLLALPGGKDCGDASEKEEVSGNLVVGLYC